MAKKWLEYLLLLGGCVVFYIFWQDYLSTFVLLFFLFLPLLSLVLLVPTAFGVIVGLEAGPGEFTHGAPIPIRVKVWSLLTARMRLRVTLRNETFRLERVETVFLSAGRGGSIDHNISSAYCGRITCRLAEARVYDFLGLFSLRRKPRGETVSFYILPRRYLPAWGEGGEIRAAEGDVFSPTTPGNDPTELFGIRDFREGDRLSRINWKLSARLGRDMVVEGGQPLASGRFILLELGGAPDILDGLLDTFHTLSAALLQRRMPHAAGWYDGGAGEPRVMEIAGEEDLTAALETILSTGRGGREPEALESCQAPPGGCSHVFYLTSRLAENAAARLHDRFPGGKRTVLLVGRETPEAPFRDPVLVPVDPADIERALRGVAL